MGTKVVAPSGGATSADKIQGGQLSWDVLPFTQQEYSGKGSGTAYFDSGVTTGTDLVNRGLVEFGGKYFYNSYYWNGSTTYTDKTLPSNVDVINARIEYRRSGSTVLMVLSGLLNYVPKLAAESDLTKDNSWWYQIYMYPVYPDGFKPCGRMHSTFKLTNSEKNVQYSTSNSTYKTNIVKTWNGGISPVPYRMDDLAQQNQSDVYTPYYDSYYDNKFYYAFSSVPKGYPTSGYKFLTSYESHKSYDQYSSWPVFSSGASKSSSSTAIIWRYASTYAFLYETFDDLPA